MHRRVLGCLFRRDRSARRTGAALRRARCAKIASASQACRPLRPCVMRTQRSAVQSPKRNMGKRAPVVSRESESDRRWQQCDRLTTDIDTKKEFWSSAAARICYQQPTDDPSCSHVASAEVILRARLKRGKPRAAAKNILLPSSIRVDDRQKVAASRSDGFASNTAGD